MPLVLLATPQGVFVAVAIMLLVWAVFYIFRKPLAELFSRIPLLGGELARVFTDAMIAVRSMAIEWAATGVTGMVELVHAPIAWLLAVLNGVASTAEALMVYADRIGWTAAYATAVIRVRLASTVATVATLVDQVATALARIATLASRIATIVTVTIPGAIATAVSRAVAVARALVSAATVTLSSAIASLRAWTGTQLAAAAAATTTAISGVQAWASAAIVATVTPLAGQLAQLGQAIDGFRTDVLGRLGVISTALAPILALQLVRVIPQVITDITTMRRVCVDPTCRVMTPQLATLDALLSGLQVTLLLALVADAVHDPVGTATESAGAAGALAGLTNSIIGPDLPARI
jgi:hypothetical protein